MSTSLILSEFLFHISSQSNGHTTHITVQQKAFNVKLCDWFSRFGRAPQLVKTTKDSDSLL